MIEKIVANQVGCLGELKSPKLKKQVLVFGENGSGKSTIAAALSSLELGQPDLIDERASLTGSLTSPNVELKIGDQTVNFDDGAWSEEAKTPIAVFDNAFVNRHVHSGDQHENEHKKSLYTVVLGDTCAEKLEEQAELAEEIKNHNRRVKDIEREIESKIPGDIDFKEFVCLLPADNLAVAIEKQTGIVDLFQKSERLKHADGFEPIELPRVSSSLAQTLAKTIASLSSDAEEKVNQHLSESTESASTRWIEQGLKHQKGDDCPFCGESTAKNPLIKAYQDFFSDAYNGLKAEINSLSGLADGYFGESVLLKQQRRFNGNEKAGEFWQPYIEVPPLDHSIFEEMSDELGECRDRVNQAIETKQQNPLESVAIDGLTLSTALLERIDDYNTLVSVANGRIEEVRESQNKGDIEMETKKLNLLQATALRHSPEIKSLVAEWESADAVKANNSEKRKDLQEAIEEETASIFEQQGEQINSILKQLDANFRLAALETNNRTKPPSVNLCVEIFDQQVQLGDKMTKSQRPFRSTLSSAERTMLAFAFFISKLKAEDRLAETIVVLDDPITSFDHVRLANTAGIVGEQLSAAEQLIVLSHSQPFLDALQAKLADAQLLQLSREQGAGSTLIAVESLSPV